MALSPLTRGKPAAEMARLSIRRLIPTHAGKTQMHRHTHSRSTAHPRSRGENGDRAEAVAAAGGSSPLTRGKLCTLHGPAHTGGLIPTHAGKTAGPPTTSHPIWAHPRSRGENGRLFPLVVTHCGSSPLTRGKLPRPVAHGPHDRLIPAHAGKTTNARQVSPSPRAHPRSRGENIAALSIEDRLLGSSPLTRGKHRRRPRPPRQRRLIPAHAGKTDEVDNPRDRRRAHPRSRGENRLRGEPYG